MDLKKKKIEENTNEQEQRKQDQNKQLSPGVVRQIFRVIVSLLGAATGPVLVLLGVSIARLLGFSPPSTFWYAILYISSAIAFGIIFYFLAPRIINLFLRVVHTVEAWLNNIPMPDILFGSIGLVAGLIIAYLLSFLVTQIPLPQGITAIISTALYVLLGTVGWSVMRKRRNELRMPDIGGENAKRGKSKDKKDKVNQAKPKILDTSVIIDGRIFDICKTGIIEGRLLIPGFVLQELRHVSDSADGLKRTRGRRGLDILNKIQKELDIHVEVSDIDYDDIAEVDAKLLKLAQDIDGVVITNDFNLNKVAAVQNVPVLNINELANAVKPVVLPGEEMRVTIIKDGKEAGQGIAYLDDGTMIVIDGGRNLAGQSMDVVVTSVLQTSAGRMIFTRLK